MSTALELDRVSVRYFRDGSFFMAAQDVSLRVAPGETLAVVGESGSGKTTIARAAVGLAPLAAGAVRYGGAELPRRGRRPVGMVFQDPLGSLDPRMTIGQAIEEVLAIHKLPAGAARVPELLYSVGLPPSAAEQRPRALSGGQQQRAAIARALAANPDVLILDEPVSALDVSVRAQILRLLASLQQELKLALVFIAHDLAVVRQLATHVAVMYRGRIVEIAAADRFFAKPLHPYSRALLSAVPALRRRTVRRESVVVRSLEGSNACVYAERCPFADGASFEAQPPLAAVGAERSVACHHWEAIAASGD